MEEFPVTVPVPRGSQARSPGQVVSEHPANPRPESSPASESDSGLTGSLGIEAGFLPVGDDNLPVRFGLLGNFRPHSIFGLGLRIDTNFSNEFAVGVRAEARASVIPELDLYGAIEGGFRVLMGQSHVVEELMEPAPLSGVLGYLGGEVGMRFPFDDVSLDIFGRLLYAPPSPVSYPGMEREGAYIPPQSTTMEGIQFAVGVRLNMEFPTGTSRAHEEEIEEPSPETSAPIERTRTAIRDFRSSLSTVVARTEAAEAESAAGSETESGASDAAPPDTRHTEASRDTILDQISGDLEYLDENAEALDQEISNSLSEYQQWIEGTETLSQLQLRMDRLYFDQLGASPPQVNLDEIQSFTQEFNNLIQNNEALRFHLRQGGEEYTTSEYIHRQLRAFMGRLSQIQINSYRDTSLGISPADLDEPIARIVEIRRHIREMRQEEDLVDFRPSTEQIEGWRSRLETMAARIEQLNGDVPDEIKAELRQRHQELQNSFEQAVANVEREATSIRLYREGLRPHLVGFFGDHDQAGEGNRRAQRERSESALSHIQAVQQTLRNVPDGFRRRYLRSMENMESYLDRFVRSELPGRDTNWHRAGEIAIEILSFLDSAYEAPELAEPRRRRRRRPTGNRASRPSRPTRPQGGNSGNTPTAPPPPPLPGAGE